MTLQQELAAAWRDHGTEPEAVYDRVCALAASCPPGESSAVLQLLVHVGTEHLGRDADVLTQLDRFDATLPSVRRARAALAAVATGSLAPLGEVAGPESERQDGPGDEAAALALVVAIAGARRMSDLANDALTRAGAFVFKLPAGHPASRALAMATNNLAVALEETTDRTSRDDDNLRTAATLARSFWERAGGWLEVERAEYRLAKAHLALGEVSAAVTHAETCLAICRGNGSGPDELAYAWEVLAESCFAAGASRRGKEALSWGRALVAAPDFPAGLVVDLTVALDRVAARDR